VKLLIIAQGRQMDCWRYLHLQHLRDNFGSSLLMQVSSPVFPWASWSLQSVVILPFALLGCTQKGQFACVGTTAAIAAV
jgi:hypothetical protein